MVLDSMTRLQQDNERLEELVKSLREQRRQEAQEYKVDLQRLLDTVQREVQKKYNDELVSFLQHIKDLRARFEGELLTKEKEIKQLHLQH